MIVGGQLAGLLRLISNNSITTHVSIDCIVDIMDFTLVDYELFRFVLIYCFYHRCWGMECIGGEGSMTLETVICQWRGDKEY